MIPLIVIRPQPGADATVAAAAVRGGTALAFPLFTIEPRPWDPPAPSEVDGLLIGSANAARQAGPSLQRFLDKPAYVVGEATAGACRAAGLNVAMTGKGGLQEVLARIGRGVRLLRLAGREHVVLHPPAGVQIVERIVYASTTRSAPPALVELLRSPAVVMLHSAAAAAHFAGECDRLGIDRARIALAAIGRRVAAASGSGWARVACALAPDDAALLAQALELCQNRDGTRSNGAE